LLVRCLLLIQSIFRRAINFSQFPSNSLQFFRLTVGRQKTQICAVPGNLGQGLEGWGSGLGLEIVVQIDGNLIWDGRLTGREADACFCIFAHALLKEIGFALHRG